MISDEESIKIISAARADPIWGIESLFQCKFGLWEKQKDIVRSVMVDNNKITAVRSCHDAGKDFVAARIALLYLLLNIDSVVITTAPSWLQVKEIFWRELRSAYNSMNANHPSLVVGGKMLTTGLELSPTWFAIGLATKKEGEATEVAERMLGFHSTVGKILVIVDEGSGVKEPIWQAIEGLLTSEDAKMLTIGNPYNIVGSFARLFSQKGVHKVHIQDTDIPNVKHNKNVIPGLMSSGYPQEMEDKYGKDSNVYLVKVKGEFPKSETNTLISLNDLEKAFEREEKAEGIKKLGVDVARFGDDRTVFIIRQGNSIIYKKVLHRNNTMEVVGITKQIMIEEEVSPEEVFVDEIGVGAGVVDRLKEDFEEINGINVSRTDFGGEDEEAEKKIKAEYLNVRAKAYWDMRDWVKKASIPRDDDYLEMANLKYKFNSTGKKKIESKEEMKKRKLNSPDVADSLMLTFCPKNKGGLEPNIVIIQ